MMPHRRCDGAVACEETAEITQTKCCVLVRTFFVLVFSPFALLSFCPYVYLLMIVLQSKNCSFI